MTHSESVSSLLDVPPHDFCRSLLECRQRCNHMANLQAWCLNLAGRGGQQRYTPLPAQRIRGSHTGSEKGLVTQVTGKINFSLLVLRGVQRGVCSVIACFIMSDPICQFLQIEHDVAPLLWAMF